MSSSFQGKTRVVAGVRVVEVVIPSSSDTRQAQDDTPTQPYDGHVAVTTLSARPAVTLWQMVCDHQDVVWQRLSGRSLTVFSLRLERISRPPFAGSTWLYFQVFHAHGSAMWFRERKGRAVLIDPDPRVRQQRTMIGTGVVPGAQEHAWLSPAAPSCPWEPASSSRQVLGWSPRPHARTLWLACYPAPTTSCRRLVAVAFATKMEVFASVVWRLNRPTLRALWPRILWISSLGPAAQVASDRQYRL